MKANSSITPLKGADKTSAPLKEQSTRTETRSPFFFKVLVYTTLMAIAFDCLGTTGCVDGPSQTSRLGRKVTAVRAGPSEIYEYQPKPTVETGQFGGDNLIPADTTIQLIPENICVEVSENREFIYGKGIGSGNEYWRFGVEGVDIPLPNNSRFPIIDGYVYLATSNGRVFKICPDNGKAVWQRNWDTQFNGQPQLAFQPEGRVIMIMDVNRSYLISPDNGDLTALSAVAAK